MRKSYFVILILTISACTLYSPDDIISYGTVSKVVNQEQPGVSQPIWLHEEPSLSNNSIKDSIYGPLQVVILKQEKDHYLVANDSLGIKGYILRGYVELDCNTTPNICQ